MMSNSDNSNCIEVLSANNSYCYEQYICEGNRLIRGNINRCPAMGRSDVEKERRTNNRNRFLNDQLVDDLQQSMPLPDVSVAYPHSNNLSGQFPSEYSSFDSDITPSAISDISNSSIAVTRSTLDEEDICGSSDLLFSADNDQQHTENRSDYLIVSNNEVPSCIMLIGKESAPYLNDTHIAILRRRSRQNTQSTRPTPKPRRPYHKYSQRDMEFVKQLHKRYPNRKQAVKEGIALSSFSRQYLNYLLRKLEKGESIDRSSVRRGRRRVFLDDHLKSMVEIIRDNPIITDGKCASLISEQYGIPMSRSSVQRIRTDYNRMKEVGATAITFKISSRRGKNAQSQENKQRRIEVAQTIQSLPSKYRVVFIDEAHWEICRKFGYAKSPVGTKAIVNNEGKGYRISAILSMSADGPHYTLIHARKNVNAESFKCYFAKLVDSFKKEYVCFYMDNASIHNRELLQQAINPERHMIVFGAPYSPEMNPIELVFATWKRNVENMVDGTPTESQLIDLLIESWKQLDKQLFRSCVGHVLDVVYPKVFRYEDI